MKKILLILLALCLLAAPGSALEITGEDPDEDLSGFVFTGDIQPGWGFDATTGNHRIYYVSSIQGGDFQFPVNIEDYFAFSYRYQDNVYSPVFLKDENGTVLVTISNLRTYVPESTYCRIELITPYSGRSHIDLYVNGIYKGTFVRNAGDIVTAAFSFGNSGGTYTKTAFFDDFSTNEIYPTVLGCNNEVISTDEKFFFSYGYPKIPDTNYWVRLVNPSGTYSEWNVSTSTGVGSYYLNRPTYFTTSGTYRLELRSEDLGTGTSYLDLTKNIVYSIPSNISLHLSDDEITAGEENLDILVYGANGCTLQVDGPGSNDMKTYTISSNEETISYQISSNSVVGRGVVILRNSAGVKVAYKYFDVVGGIGTDGSINFDKSAYTNTQKVSITYSDLPVGTQVKVTGGKSGSTSKPIDVTYTKSGSGTFTYQLSGQDISWLYVVAAYDGELLDSDSASIASGDDYAISGTVYDTDTLAVIEGATVNIGGTVQYTDDAGRYSFTTSAGTKNVNVGATGYNTFSSTLDLISITTTKNFYLTPVITSKSILYGACSDYDTGESIGKVFIQITNGSTTYSTLGRSTTGAYTFEGLENGSTWTLTATKSGYNNYQKSITIDNSTFHLIRLTSIYTDTEEETDTDSDSSETTTTERPGRQAAKDSMAELEKVVPGLISFVVLVVFIQLMKEI